MMVPLIILMKLFIGKYYSRSNYFINQECSFANSFMRGFHMHGLLAPVTNANLVAYRNMLIQLAPLEWHGMVPLIIAPVKVWSSYIFWQAKWLYGRIPWPNGRMNGTKILPGVNGLIQLFQIWRSELHSNINASTTTSNKACPDKSVPNSTLIGFAIIQIYCVNTARDRIPQNPFGKHYWLQNTTVLDDKKIAEEQWPILTWYELPKT